MFYSLARPYLPSLAAVSSTMGSQRRRTSILAACLSIVAGQGTSQPGPPCAPHSVRRTGLGWGCVLRPTVLVVPVWVGGVRVCCYGPLSTSRISLGSSGRSPRISRLIPRAAPLPTPTPTALRCAAHAASHSADVVVYGASAPGCVAAIAAARTGVSSVLLASPHKHIGGMTTGGLQHADVVWQPRHPLQAISRVFLKFWISCPAHAHDV